MKKFNALSTNARLFIIAALCIALGLSLGAIFNPKDNAHAQPAQEIGRASLVDIQDAFTSIVDEVKPSVVSITSVRTVQTRSGFPGFDDDFFFGFPFQMPRPGVPEQREEQRESYGSGVIVRNDGYILTNDHVVGGADKVIVHLNDGREMEGTVTRDPLGDLALIKIDAKDLPTIKLGNSDVVKVGSWAIAIGSPFGLTQTVTVGVVSATGRFQTIPDAEVERRYTNMIQTDASINPGNSGGPLVNINGELIGINTLIRSTMQGNIGIGFAIPVNSAKYVMEELIEHGKVSRGRLGVEITNLTPETAEQYGADEGALVRSVMMDSAADKAGIQVEDVIVKFDGKDISSTDQLIGIVEKTRPGTEAEVVVIRNKTRQTLKITVGDAEQTVTAAESSEEIADRLGFTISNITSDVAERFRIGDNVKGIAVTGVARGSSAARAGIQPGMVILQANDQPVANVSEFEAIIGKMKSGESLRLHFQTRDRRGLLVFPIN